MRGVKRRPLTPLVQYAAGSSGVNGTWAYRNGAADMVMGDPHKETGKVEVGYSHMAMVEKLPIGGEHAYLAVWQAAHRCDWAMRWERVTAATATHKRSTTTT